MRETEATRDGTVKIGGAILLRSEAFSAAEKYLSGNGTYAYPAYDGFESQADPNRLTDGELLAPILLNVRPTIRAYYSLQSTRPELENWLDTVDVDQRLDAQDVDLAHLGRLFGVLDKGLPDVRGTTLAKVMHRKRPHFIPLYDEMVRRLHGASRRPGATSAEEVVVGLHALARGSWRRLAVFLGRRDLQRPIIGLV
jgi:hypothetical protein